MSRFLLTGEMKMAYSINYLSVSTAELEKIEDGRDICDFLTRNNQLAPDNLAHLQQLLVSCGRKDLAARVSRQIQIKAGPVGCGKSQLSFWYARNNSGLFDLVWKFQCQTPEHLTRSMKALLETLDIEFIELVKNQEQYILMMGELICKSLSINAKKSSLFLFDDVQKPCLQMVKKLLVDFKNLKDNKIILTCNNSHIDQEIEIKPECCIRMNGMSEDEAVEFFRKSNYFKDVKDDDIKQLSKKLGRLPLGLFTARSYIQRTRISINTYMTHLDDEDFLKSIDMIKDADYDKGLMASQLLVLEEMKSLLSPLVYKFLYFVPLLDYENIPVSLLYGLLPSHLSDAAKTGQVGAFIQVLGEYSLGDVRGIDDDRVISFHAATKLAMSLLPSFKEQCKENVFSLVKILASHIDMDGRQCTTLSGNLMLLEHAYKVLQKAEIHLEQTDEVLILQSYLSCTLGVTYRLQGCDDIMAHQCLTKALQICLKIIGKDESVIYNLFVQPGYQADDFAIEDVVKDLYQALVAKGKSVNVRFYNQFLEDKKRSERDIEHLMHRGQLQREDFTNNKISRQCHGKLISKNLAVSSDLLQQFFLIELLMSISYNYGRNLYRMKHSHHKSLEEILSDCRCFFFLSYQLSNLMKKEYQHYLPVQSLIAERNGSLYLLIRDASFGKTDKAKAHKSLMKAVDRLEFMLSEKRDCFEFGVLKLGPEFDQHHVGMCYKLLLKCYIRLYNLEEGKMKEQQYQKGLEYVKKLDEIENQLQNWIALAGFHVQIAKLYRLKGSLGNLERAINHLEKAIQLENRDQMGTLSHFMLQAKFNIIRCYIDVNSTESLEQARGICEGLVQHLESTNREKSLNNAKSLMDEINGKINLDVHMFPQCLICLDEDWDFFAKIMIM
ncbi:hypothetical protein KUTeg_016443 [Tegillarca granosa]|uniref:DED domain-containing protein n=1 Tax=Tegillarca granosa TaxID=220873 RepID=A0ABQ9EKV6_TEGGR|nr:hypothetical protein KUTeg_016443 [Tegillarca granosa]